MAKVKSQFDGQISMFDLMELSFADALNDRACPVSFEERREKVLEKKEDYLQKGDILLTLAKERLEKELKHLTLSEFDKKLTYLNLSSDDGAEKTASKIAQCIIRPVLSTVSSFTADDEDYMLLKSAIDYDFDIEKVSDTDEGWNCAAVRGLRNKYRRSTDIIRLTLREYGWPELSVYGYRTLSHQGKVCRDGRYADGSGHADIAMMLAYMVIFTKFMRCMDDADMRSMIASSLKDEHFNMNTPDELFLLSNERSYVEEQGVTARELLTGAATKSRVTVSYDRYKRVSYPALDYFFEVNGLDKDKLYADPECPDRSLRTLNHEDKMNGKSKPYRYFLGAEIEWGLFCADPEKAWSKGLGRVCYNSLLSRLTRSTRFASFGEEIPPSWALPSWRRQVSYYAEKVVMRAFHAVYERDRQVSLARSMFSDNHSEHAKAYMTKKAIPRSVLKEMEESVLNNYFGYVEYDSSCDMEKVSVIIDEFIAFHDTYMPCFDSSSVQIRFRKLGNHKALGLYIPLFRCLCVDVGSPSSLIHEYGHCIDHSCENSVFSMMPDFYPVYEKYKEGFLSNVSEDLVLCEELSNKRRKYNIDYYLSYSEVFARCFELYVTKCLGVKNSICGHGKDKSFAYPDNEELVELISIYFAKLLSHYQNAGQNAAA